MWHRCRFVSQGNFRMGTLSIIVCFYTHCSLIHWFIFLWSNYILTSCSFYTFSRLIEVKEIIVVCDPSYKDIFEGFRSLSSLLFSSHSLTFWTLADFLCIAYCCYLTLFYPVGSSTGGDIQTKVFCFLRNQREYSCGT